MTVKLVTPEGEFEYVECDGGGFFVAPTEDGGFRVIVMTTSVATGDSMRVGFDVRDKPTPVEAAMSVAHSLRAILVNWLLEEYQAVLDTGELSSQGSHTQALN